MVPADPTAHLIMIEADFAVAQFEHLFDAVAVVVGVDNLVHWHGRGGVA